jgi:hypothetical protein
MSNDPRILPGATVLPPMEPTSRPTKSNNADKPKRNRDARNRFATLNAFADYGARHVGTTAQACWWIIFRETKPDGMARIAHRRIAECIGTSRHTVLRALATLEKNGLLIVVKRGDFSGASSIYRLRAMPPDRYANATATGSAHATGGVAKRDSHG